MSKRLFRALFPGVVIVLALAAGCVPIPAQTSGAGASSTPSVTTVEPLATTAVTPTTVLSGTVAVTVTTEITATPSLTATIPVTSTAAISATPALTATAGVNPTAEVSTSVAPGATAAASTPSTSGEGTPSGQLSVTLADNGKTITLKPGDRFLLYLGEGYDWEVNIADQNVVSRVIGVLTIRGSQGLFEAHQAGTTMLTAAGNPTCLSQQPACALPSQLVQVQVVVSQ